MIRLEGWPVIPTRFPDNTCQVWKIPKNVIRRCRKAPQPVEVQWEFSYEGEFMELAQLKMLLDSMNFRSRLAVAYLPYARQDKDIGNKSTFALHTFAKLLNSLEFESVLILDAHSSISKVLIKNSYIVYPETAVQNLLHKLPVYPDKGARDKYAYIYGPGAYGHKVRDQATGDIKQYAVHGSVSGRSCLIIDDICDGGATFIALAHALKNAGAANIEMFVTHGLFTKGTRILFDAGISRIYTARGEVFPRTREENV